MTEDVDGSFSGTSSADQASRLQVSLSAPNTQFKVWRSTADNCFTCACTPSSPDLRKAQLPAATSLAAMLATDGESYFYDQAAGVLYLLLGPSKPVFIERVP